MAVRKVREAGTKAKGMSGIPLTVPFLETATREVQARLSWRGSIAMSGKCEQQDLGTNCTCDLIKMGMPSKIPGFLVLLPR